VHCVRIDYSHRAMRLVEDRGGVIWFVWYWVGTHEEYQRRLP
jgi:hypothetical protein